MGHCIWSGAAIAHYHRGSHECIMNFPFYYKLKWLTTIILYFSKGTLASEQLVNIAVAGWAEDSWDSYVRGYTMQSYASWRGWRPFPTQVCYWSVRLLELNQQTRMLVVTYISLFLLSVLCIGVYVKLRISWEESTQNPTFLIFQRKYIPVYLLVVLGDWLQGKTIPTWV